MPPGGRSAGSSRITGPCSFLLGSQTKQGPRGGLQGLPHMLSSSGKLAPASGSHPA